MANKFTKLLNITIIIIFVAIWVSFLRTPGNHDFVLDNTPIVAINYSLTSNNTDELILEKSEKLRLASLVFSLQNPQIKRAEIVVGDYAKFADYNIFSASDRDQFLATATIKNLGVDSNNFVSEVLEDKDNQKFVSIYPGQNYSIYLRFKSDPSFQPTRVIINNIIYPLSKTDSDFYLVNNFFSTDVSAVGMKIENDRSNIQEAFFVTDKIKLKSSLNRVVSNSDYKVNRSGKMLEIKIPKKSFILLFAGTGISLDNQALSNSRPDLIGTYEYDTETQYSASRINLNKAKALSLVSESGKYDIKDSVVERKLVFVTNLSLLLVTIALGLGYRKSVIVSYTYLWLSKDAWSLELKKFLQNRSVELSVVGAVMLFLLILRANPVGEQIFTATNLLVILFVFLLIILRFTIRHLMPILIFLIGIVAILKQFNYLTIGEKAGKLLFLVILIIVISIIFSREKPIVKKHYGKQKKN